ncbi:MAG: CoA transferase subunit A [Candidatus Hodarchaeales archaeon]
MQNRETREKKQHETGGSPTEYSKIHQLENICDLVPRKGVIGIGGILNDRKPWSVLSELLNHGSLDGFSFLTFLGSFEIDLFCKKGFSGEIITSAVTLETLGMARNFRKAVEAGKVIMTEYSELSFLGALRASSMNLPFFPVRALFGTDILEVHPGWKVLESPYPPNQTYVAVPPIKIDVAIIHAHRADELGNVQIDTPLAGPYTAALDYDLLLAKASQMTIVSVEEIVPRSVVRSNPGKTYIPGFLIDSVIHAPKGARPGSFLPFYSSDLESMVELLNTEDE